MCRLFGERDDVRPLVIPMRSVSQCCAASTTVRRQITMNGRDFKGGRKTQRGGRMSNSIGTVAFV